MNGQTFWVQAIGDVASAPTVTQNDLAGTTIAFHLSDGRKVEVKSRDSLALLYRTADNAVSPTHYMSHGLSASVSVPSSKIGGEASAQVTLCPGTEIGTAKIRVAVAGLNGGEVIVLLRIWPLTSKCDHIGDKIKEHHIDRANLRAAQTEIEERRAEEEEEEDEEEEEEEEEDDIDLPSPEALVEVIAWLTKMAQRGGE